MKQREMHERPAKPRQPYAPPRMLHFGAIRELTAQGSAGDAESASGMADMCGPRYMGTQGGGC